MSGRSRYWERRAAEDKKRAYQDAEALLAEIEKLHSATRRDIRAMAIRIRARFRKAYGLTREQANELMNSPVGREEYLQLLAEIGRLGPKNPKRDELLAKAAAPAYAYRESIAEAMEDELVAVTARLAEQEARLLTDHLTRTAQEQSLRAGFRIQQRAGVGFRFGGVSEELARVMIHRPWSGMDFSARIWQSQDALADVLNDVLRTGLTIGKSGEAIAKEISEAMNVSMHRARTLVRTETTYVCNQADMAAYEEAELDRLRFSAVLDLKTSRICRSLDGKIILRKDAIVGENFPPMHPNCRSLTVVVFSDEELKRMERWSRDPVTGKGVKVPADMTYEEWLKMQKDTYGEERIAAAQKMVDNKARDQKQLEEYQSVLGKKHAFLKSREAFQQMKYLNEETYRFVKLDYERQKTLKLTPERALPNAKAAKAADEKFTRYLFNPENSTGYAKGVAITKRLGYNADNWQALRKEVLEGARKYPASVTGTNNYGTKYEQYMVLYGQNGTPANVKVAWILEGEETRMTTMFIEEVKGWKNGTSSSTNR